MTAADEYKVLIVDDEPSMRSAFPRALRCPGYGIIAAGDGVEALTILKDHPADTFAAAPVDLRVPRIRPGQVPIVPPCTRAGRNTGLRTVLPTRPRTSAVGSRRGRSVVSIGLEAGGMVASGWRQMIELDTSQLPVHVVAVLTMRGAPLPPLQWHLNPNRAAKRTLDEVADDRELLGRDPLVDAGMAAAVRALLYFWNGWPADAGMYAELAPGQERIYLAALCKRQAGESAAAKSLFQEIVGHPIYAPLADFAKQVTAFSAAPLLKRLQDVIAFAEQWEPHAFCDVFEQARADDLDPVGEQVVRRLQCREFELLFEHCLKAATGIELAQRQSAVPVRDRRPQPTRRPRPADRIRPDVAPPAQSPRTGPALDPVAVGSGVWVLCPKCQLPKTVPESSRGCGVKCDKCGTSFLVPARRLKKGAPKR